MSDDFPIERIHQLASAIDRFRTPGDPLRERLLAETPHMHGEIMAHSLDLALEGWDEPGIASLWSEESVALDGAITPELVAVVLGGVLPPSHIQAIAYAYLLGAEVIVKHASQDPLFPALFAEALGDGITVVSRLGLGGVLARADAVIAIGDDDGVRAIQAEVAVGMPFLGFGHRVAVELVGDPGAARSTDLAAEIAKDISAFDQLGCLSPREILVVGTPNDALALAMNLDALLTHLPDRASLGPAIEGALRHEREMAKVAGHTLFGRDDLHSGGWIVDGGAWTGTPGGRHVVIRTVEGLAAALEALQPIAGSVSAVGVAGFEPSDHLRAQLARLGASRVVPAGRLQCPPPTWPHDGKRPLVSLCRFCGAE